VKTSARLRDHHEPIMPKMTTGELQYALQSHAEALRTISAGIVSGTRPEAVRGQLDLLAARLDRLDDAVARSFRGGRRNPIDDGAAIDEYAAAVETCSKCYGAGELLVPCERHDGPDCAECDGSRLVLHDCPVCERAGELAR